MILAEPRRKQLQLVQVCRGLAAMLVVLCHLSGSTEPYFGISFLGDIFFQGFIGVDFFFVLSGFIIAHVHFVDVQSGRNGAVFLKKRFIRIYPIYWVIATVYLVMLFAVDGKTSHMVHEMDFSSPREWVSIFWSYLLGSPEYGFFLPVAWSLAYEVIFYLAFFGFILLGFNRSKYLFLAWGLLVLANTAFRPDLAVSNLMIFNPRIAEFMVGCLVAFYFKQPRVINSWLLKGLFVVATILFFLVYPAQLQTDRGIMVMAFFMGLVVLAVVQSDLKESSRKYPGFLMLIGEASYSIYLSHLIFLSILFRVFQFLVQNAGISHPLILNFFVVLLFAITVWGGVLIYRFVEKPLIGFFSRHLLKKKIDGSKR